MKLTIRASIAKEEDPSKFPCGEHAHAEFKGKIATVWYPLFLDECNSTILRALAFGPNRDSKEQHLLQARRMFRYECQKLGDDFNGMGRKAAIEDSIIKKAKEAS